MKNHISFCVNNFKKTHKVIWESITERFAVYSDIKSLRPLALPGAHVRGWNAGSIGVCYEGGLDECGRPADTRTPFQRHSLRVLVLLLLKDYPGSRLCGHRDLSPDLNHNGEIEPEEWVKQCPCFDAATILTEPAPPNPAYLWNVFILFLRVLRAHAYIYNV